MADGLSATNVSATLSEITGSASFAQLHVGAPGAVGTANASSVTTREAVTWAAPSGVTITASNTPEWPSWAGTNGEVVTDVTFWSASSGGTFEFSAALNASVTMNVTDSLSLTPLSVTIPVAS